MAGNVFAARIWTLDTAFTTALTDDFYVSKMVWEPSANGDDLVVKNAAGTTVWILKAVAAATDAGPEVWENPDPCRFFFKGFDLDTIDGGTLRVFLQ